MDYEWVYEYAKAQCTDAVAHYRRVDDKASTVLNYLGAGTGLLTLGSLASADKASALAILSFIPAFVLAVIAVYLSSKARSTFDILAMPCPVDMAISTEHCHDSKCDVKMIATKSYVSVINSYQSATMKKARLIDRSLWYFRLAIVLLSLPMLVVIAEKLIK